MEFINLSLWKERMFILSFRRFFYYVLFFFLISFLLTMLPQYRNVNLNISKGDLEKTRAFECGFNIIKKNFQGFSVTFLKIAILFLLVDLEIALLIPLFNKRGLLLSRIIPLTYTISILSFFLIFLLIIEKAGGGLKWKELS